MSDSKHGKVFRSEGPPHIPVQQGLNHFGIQHSDLKATGSGRPTILLPAEPFEPFSHEADPPVDFDREVSVFVDNAA